jgi:hypothetical protein
MFFSIFWTAYIPVCMVILSLIGEWLMRSVRQLRAHAWIVCSNRRRIRRSDLSRIVSPAADIRKSLPPASGSLSDSLRRNFSQYRSKFAQATGRDAAYLSFRAGAPEPLTKFSCSTPIRGF